MNKRQPNTEYRYYVVDEKDGSIIKIDDKEVWTTATSGVKAMNNLISRYPMIKDQFLEHNWVLKMDPAPVIKKKVIEPKPKKPKVTQSSFKGFATDPHYFQ